MVTQLLGVLDVHGGDPGDPLGVNILQLDLDSVGQGEEDAQLMGGVDALHIQGGVCFGIPEFLGLFQNLGKVQPLLSHLRQDVVGGPVQNAEDDLDLVGHQPFFQRTDDGDPPSHAPLEPDVHPGLIGGLENLRSVDRQEGFIGGDNMFAALDGLEDEGPSRLQPADEFDDDGDLRVIHDVGNLRREQGRIDFDPPVPG